MKELKEIAVDYRSAIKQLNQRIRELTEQKEKAIAECRKSHEDPEHNGTVTKLGNRIRPLVTLKNDLVEVTREVEHYYDRWWYRSGKYTFNKDISGQAVYAGSSR